MPIVRVAAMTIENLIRYDAAELLELGVELILVFICSGIIGFEREQKNRPAGLRTHMIVATTAMLIMHIGGLLAENFISSDPTRMAAQVVSGIGFLGAGTILRNRTKDEVHGLTTAATLWAVAAVGIAIGAGYVIEGVISTFAIMMILSIASRFDNYFTRKRSLEYRVDVDGWINQLEILQSILETNDYKLEDYAIQGHYVDEAGNPRFHIFLRIKPKVKSRTLVPRGDIEELLGQFSFIHNIKKA